MRFYTVCVYEFSFFVLGWAQRREVGRMELCVTHTETKNPPKKSAPTDIASVAHYTITIYPLTFACKYNNTQNPAFKC